MNLYFKIIPVALLTFLSACGEDESAENFLGRWAHEKRSEIIQINEIDTENLAVSRTMLFNNQYVTDEFTGTMDDKGGLLTNIGRFVFDESTGHLKTDGGTFVSAPEGWMLRDGRDKLLN